MREARDHTLGMRLFWLPPPLETAFRREFSAARYQRDLSFLAIHCLVAMGYIAKVGRRGGRAGAVGRRWQPC